MTRGKIGLATLFIIIFALSANFAAAQSMGSAALQARAKLPEWSGYWRVKDTNRLLDPTQKGPAQTTNPLWRSRPPLKPELDTAYAAAVVRSAEQGAAQAGRKPILDSHTLYCLAGPLRSISNGFQKIFIITPEKTQFISGGEIRTIYTDGRQFPPDYQMPETAQGYSIGRWEGETLVFQTRKIYAGHWADGTPLMFSSKMILDEKLSRIDAQTINDELTITDPETLTRPWTFTRVLTHRGAQTDPTTWPQDKEICAGPGNRIAVTASGQIVQQVGVGTIALPAPGAASATAGQRQPAPGR